ncbi:MAG: helix-turn-helix domain-containing protein [Ignavibacteria bacterium]|nr:helix-turn-helix domain-containing protein [Ignavibacteria bacterium]
MRNRSVLFIKNMVSLRCISDLENILSNLESVQVLNISLGKAEIFYDEAKISIEDISTELSKNNFQIISDRNTQLVEQIKNACIELIYFGNNTNSLIRNSEYLSEKLNLQYSYISKFFSENTDTTLEKFLIKVKIEKVKELLSYNEMSLSEIAYMMGYSSVQYLSNQFRHITGVSVTEYKHGADIERIPLENLLL